MAYSRFQSTLPRGERPDFWRPDAGSADISIHAPARGATHLGSMKKTFINISIHAPARGATQVRKHAVVIQWHFNPRSREGSDFKLEIFSELINNFNPRSREGSDKKENTVLIHSIRFQSTLPRGERPELLARDSRITTFQSTLPRGERPGLMPTGTRETMISIHAPARGATHLDFMRLTFLAFQSTLPRGERRTA